MSIEMTSQRRDKLYLPMADDFVAEALAKYDTGDFTEQLAATPKGRGYHIQPHGQQVHDTSVTNRQILLEAGVSELLVPSLFTTRTASASHDEAFYEYYGNPKIQAEHASPEAYAMYLYRKRGESRRFRLDEQTIEEGQSIIATTQANKQCLTWGQLIVCEADVHMTTLENTERMDEDTEVLHGEYQITTNKTISKLGYNLLSLGILKTINMVNMNFPDIEKVEYFAVRHEQMRQNLDARARRIGEEASGPEVIRLTIDTMVPEIFRPITRKIMRVENVL